MATPDDWRVLAIDDDAETLRQIEEFYKKEPIFEGQGPPKIISVYTFEEAISVLETQRIDLVILDIKRDGERKDDKAGIKVYEEIRKARFVPIVFYTGLPSIAKDFQSIFIGVVEKTQGLKQLAIEIKRIFSTGLPLINRGLHKHVEAIQRDYMWEFVTSNWESFSQYADKLSIAHLLARRLAMSLSKDRIREFALEIGLSDEEKYTEDFIHGMQYYIIPPVSNSPFTGDIFQGKIGQIESYWILLTPTCDMVVERPKAEFILVAQCLKLEEHPSFVEWQKDWGKNRSRLKELLTNNSGQKDRHFFLPGALEVPNLLVDFQQLLTIPTKELATLERLASLDSPFAESLISRYGRYIGRIGTPDLDVDHIISEIEKPPK